MRLFIQVPKNGELQMIVVERESNDGVVLDDKRT